MSDSNFRLFIGIWLIVGLFFDEPRLLQALLVLLLFEGVTNLRLSLLLWRLRFGGERHFPDAACPAGVGCLPFEAERGLRLVLVLLLFPSLYLYPGTLWWVPWLVGYAMIAAGLSGICPMVLALRRAGLR
ncbi:hypothetical protein QVG61_08960 [Thiohalobacter sp. IOR34]|uniref:hypothetical protein n=1 Tax=Thiohalobacter sp. IOR34 TaxID=3057176 RepID=UPI0025B0D451|nr:hypothetical protein [Thiohalobacter sp. IOR34]WJW74632.1 hypothetical protein QVG61_08960 [Thiohalobacter sp. IOR34]